MPCAKLVEYLLKNGVEFELREHPSAYAAEDVALKAEVSGRFFAKTVLIRIDGEMAMAVLPADCKIDFMKLKGVSNAKTITLALEHEFEARFPDCELGAMPPFGNLYDMPVFVADSLARAETVSFNAGTHTEVVTMPFVDFMNLVKPETGKFTFRRLLVKKAWS